MAQEGQPMVVAVVLQEPQMIVKLSEDLEFPLLKIVVAVRRGLVPLENTSALKCHYAKYKVQI